METFIFLLVISIVLSFTANLSAANDECKCAIDGYKVLRYGVIESSGVEWMEFGMEKNQNSFLLWNLYGVTVLYDVSVVCTVFVRCFTVRCWCLYGVSTVFQCNHLLGNSIGEEHSEF